MIESRSEIGAQRTKAQALVLTVIMALIGLLCLFATESVSRYTLYDMLTGETQLLVDDAIHRNMVTFAVVSGIKATLSVIEGSTMGISLGMGFHLQIGDLVQPAYDYVDLVWRFMLYSLIILGIYKLLLETGVLAIGLQVIGLGLVLWAVARMYGRYGPTLTRWGKRFVFLGILFAYVVPIALLATHYLSIRYTEPIKASYHVRIEVLQQELSEKRDEFLALRDRVSILRPTESYNETKATLLRMAEGMADTVYDGMMVCIYFVLVVFFELFFFPLLSAFVLYKFLHYALDRLLEVGPQLPKPSVEPAETAI